MLQTKSTPTDATPKTAEPVHEIRLGRVKASLWANDTEHGRRYKVTIQELYKQDNQWKSASSYGADTLLLVAKAADMAHTWILRQSTGNDNTKWE